MKTAFIACGLGQIDRGFESTTRNWFFALKKCSTMEAELYSGGKTQGAFKVWSISRNGRICRLLRGLNLIHDGCRIEQASFAFGLLPWLFHRKPRVIWFQEYTLGLCLLRWRRLFGFNYRLLYCNGAPLGPREYYRFDFIQHLEPQSLADGLAARIPAWKMMVFPHVLPGLRTASREEGVAWRLTREIPAGAWVVLSVAAWNKHHKRIDYVLREVAAMNDPEVHLLLCGQSEAETSELRRLGEGLLGGRVHWHSLAQSEMPLAYAAADAFVLASLTEAFGLVLIESAARGLPTLAHEHPAAKFILEDPQWLGDFSRPGALAGRMTIWKADPAIARRAAALAQSIQGRFSEETLVPQFVDLLKRVAEMDLPVKDAQS